MPLTFEANRTGRSALRVIIPSQCLSVRLFAMVECSGEKWKSDAFANGEETTINLFATPGINFSDNLGLVNESIELVEQKRDSNNKPFVPKPKPQKKEDINFKKPKKKVFYRKK